MFARKAVFSSIGRATVMATVAAMALTVVEPSPARAGSAASGNGLSSASAAHRVTDFSSRGRYHGGGGAAAAAFAGIVGTGLAIAATQNRRAYYDGYDAYGYGGPVYGGPVYYGGPAYYGGPGYYGGYGSYGSSSQSGGQPTGNW